MKVNEKKINSIGEEKNFGQVELLMKGNMLIEKNKENI